MKNGHTQAYQTAHRLRLMVCLAALAVSFTVSRPQSVYADDGIVLPLIPANLEVPAGNTAFLEGHASGTQNYICLLSDSGFSWRFFGPQATLFNDHDDQIITHFLSSNPDEGDTPRATWQHSRDTSTVWAMAIASSSDTNFVASGAIPWLLLQIVGAEPGPAGGNRLTRTTFIHRLNTSGGVAPVPSTECDEPADIGKNALVPYTADYIFYKAVKRK